MGWAGDAERRGRTSSRIGWNSPKKYAKNGINVEKSVKDRLTDRCFRLYHRLEVRRVAVRATRHFLFVRGSGDRSIRSERGFPKSPAHRRVPRGKAQFRREARPRRTCGARWPPNDLRHEHLARRGPAESEPGSRRSSRGAPKEARLSLCAVSLPPRRLLQVRPLPRIPLTHRCEYRSLAVVRTAPCPEAKRCLPRIASIASSAP